MKTVGRPNTAYQVSRARFLSLLLPHKEACFWSAWPFVVLGRTPEVENLVKIVVNIVFIFIMGSFLGKAMKDSMDENMKKNQEFMIATQKLTVSN